MTNDLKFGYVRGTSIARASPDAGSPGEPHAVLQAAQGSCLRGANIAVRQSNFCDADRRGRITKGTSPGTYPVGERGHRLIERQPPVPDEAVRVIRRSRLPTRALLRGFVMVIRTRSLGQSHIR